jgi:hypothetical protein
MHQRKESERYEKRPVGRSVRKKARVGGEGRGGEGRGGGGEERQGRVDGGERGAGGGNKVLNSGGVQSR